jgi:hypothetical protein
MRRPAGLLALFIVLILAIPAFGQQQPPQPPPQQPQPPAPAPEQVPSGPRSILPGRSLAGIAIGGAISLVVRRFGQPSEIRATPVDTFYNYSRVGIGVYARDGRVTAVSTTNSLMSFEVRPGDPLGDRLGVGYRREDAVRIFGGQFREGVVEGSRGLVYDARGIAFGLDGNAIAVVLVFRPGAAAGVSGLLPAAPGAAQVPPSGFPNVAGLRPFSAEANFMSLPGYLRWLVFQTSGQWITYAEASRIVREQLGQ